MRQLRMSTKERKRIGKRPHVILLCSNLVHAGILCVTCFIAPQYVLNNNKKAVRGCDVTASNQISASYDKLAAAIDMAREWRAYIYMEPLP